MKKPLKLSPRERQIVSLITRECLSNKELADKLKITEGTVKNYLHRLYEKLNVDGRMELMLWGLAMRRIEEDQQRRREEPAA